MVDKFISPVRPPEGRVRELLDCLTEELSEAIQRICKAQRFGLSEIQEGQSLTNDERIVYELADVETVIEMLQEEGILYAKQSNIDCMKKLKRAKLEHYLQTLGINKERT